MRSRVLTPSPPSSSRQFDRNRVDSQRRSPCSHPRCAGPLLGGSRPRLRALLDNSTVIASARSVVRLARIPAARGPCSVAHALASELFSTIRLQSRRLAASFALLASPLRGAPARWLTPSPPSSSRQFDCNRVGSQRRSPCSHPRCAGPLLGGSRPRLRALLDNSTVIASARSVVRLARIPAARGPCSVAHALASELFSTIRL